MRAGVHVHSRVRVRERSKLCAPTYVYVQNPASVEPYQTGLVAAVNSPASMIADVAIPSFDTWEMLSPSTEEANPSFDICFVEKEILI